MREIHLVQDDDEHAVRVARALRFVERLQKLGLVEAPLERVEVANEILAIPPPGLHLDEGGSGTQCTSKGQRQARLPGPADALKQVEPAHRHAGEKAANVGQGVVQLLTRRRIVGDSVLQVAAERSQIRNLVEHRHAALKGVVAIHLTA